MHRGQMRAGRAIAKSKPFRLTGKGLDMTRQGIVGLVAMEIDHETASRRDLAQRGHGPGALGHRALEMRDPADHLDAAIERAFEVFRRVRRAEVAVLRESDELQIEIWLYLRLHIEQRLDREQTVIANVDVAADGEQ